jgi:phage terminase large subunit
VSKTKAKFPKKLEVLFEPKRYKVLYGGRGGAKSWGIARALLIQGAAMPLRILCAREIQRSISDSVHQLLQDQIILLGLEDEYIVKKKEILGKNGTQFGFEGLKHNIQSLKSYEGANICWVEEAQTVTKNSWDILIPTIRKENSEIWISFNADLEEDETYQRFVINPPKESIVVKINYADNPYFPKVLDKEREEMLERDPVGYQNVWLGKPKQAIEGAVYADELTKAAEERRITEVPYDEAYPVQTYWDLGHSDQTAIWFAQSIGMENRMIDYYSNSHKKVKHYLDYLQELPYTYGNIHLPHDAEAEQLAAETTVADQIRNVYHDKVIIVPNIGVEDGINSARNIFANTIFDHDKCNEGLYSLRRYAYKRDVESGRISRKPEHTIWSHGADAFRYFAVSVKQPQTKSPLQDFSMWAIG